MPMNDIALSTAVFLFYDDDEPYGKYEDGFIVSNTGWPDFYFPDLVLNRSQTYTFEATFDWEVGAAASTTWVYAGSDADLPAGYQDYETAFDYQLFFPTGSEDQVFTFTIGPDSWDGIPLGYNTPWFETHIASALAGLRYTGDAIVGELETSRLPGRSAFAT